jgi:filamentous hemagglutinin family protein
MIGFVIIVSQSCCMISFPSNARWLIAACLWASTAAMAQAQIIPDNTLAEVERSQVVPEVIGGAAVDMIVGGAERGSNLFHSFTQFNVNRGQVVFFYAPDSVQNILARVTGGPSTILGAIGSDANLFLINSGGIIFGPNARLFGSGTFLATTASHVQFPEGNFSAALSGPPLLTISAPIGLGFETTPAAITASGVRLINQNDLTLVGGNIEIDNSRLITADHKIELVALGGAGNIGLNLTDTGVHLALPASLPRADVILRDKTTISTDGKGEGSISITARNLTIANRSKLSAAIIKDPGTLDTQGKDIVLNVSDRTILQGESSILTSVLRSDGNGGNILINTGSLEVLSGSDLTSLHTGNGNSGSIIINASGDVAFKDEISDRSLPLISSAKTAAPRQGEGNTGNIQINANNLELSDGASFNTSSNRIGNSGSINLNIRDSIAINGLSIEFPFQAGLISAIGLGGQGRGGNISIVTGSLTLTNGVSIESTLLGEGIAGQININARDAVILKGDAPAVGGLLNAATGIRSNIALTGTGQGGDIQINARSLSVSQGATINSGVLGVGQGGNILINTGKSTVIEGEGRSLILSEGQLQSSTSSITSIILGNDGATISQGGTIRITTKDLQILGGAGISTRNGALGNAGNIEVNARSGITVSGQAQDGQQSDISSAVIGGQGEVPGFGMFSFQGFGRAGNIKLTADRLKLQAGLVTAFSSSPTGSAGNVDIRVNDLFLDRARIRTDSTSGNGGNIAINANNLLLLRRNSSITASAGTLDLGGNGGNISLSTTNLVAVPKENSDITANAFTGNGGNISLTTTSLLGIKPQPNLTSFSDITASSAQGIQGSIAITQPDLRPEQGLTELPNDVTDASNQISPTCPRPGSTFTQGRFIATGRGSLPPTPLDTISPSLTLPPLARFEKGEKSAIAHPVSKQRTIALARIATSCGVR